MKSVISHSEQQRALADCLMAAPKFLPRCAVPVIQTRDDAGRERPLQSSLGPFWLTGPSKDRGNEAGMGEERQGGPRAQRAAEGGGNRDTTSFIPK